MDTFFLNLTQFENTGSIGKIFISLGNLITNFYFRNWKSFFVTFTILLFDSESCLPFIIGNEQNLKEITSQAAKNQN